MKPSEARRLHQQRAQASLMHSEKMRAALTDTPDRPTPHLVPDEPDRTHTLREYRRLARLAAGERGAKRDRCWTARSSSWSGWCGSSGCWIWIRSSARR